MPHTFDYDAEKVCNQLLSIAKEDNIISTDESAILVSIRENIDKYFKILDKNYADDEITADEHHQFYIIRNEILEEALSVAKQDDQITQEEYKLLQKLREVLKKLEEDEHY